MQKRLTRSNDRILSGVLGGIANYFDVDPTIVRLAYVLMSMFLSGFPGIIAYIVLAIAMPEPSAIEGTITSELEEEIIIEKTPSA